ncbi:methenyltetrahydromethanopterin cyclohydrolase [Planctomicrobium sp. SH661]|uniref:methenyltetrahydromethanopterin cyclohydrolase n=1 Tax=Planctomicrobium sp. SH661 TaxID=3448124 RepID=UPI003F5B172E
MVEEEQNSGSLNDLAWDLVHQLLAQLDELRIEPVEESGPGIVLDFGIEAAGSLAAGLALAEVCTSGLAEFTIAPGTLDSIGWPMLSSQTDNPVEACLLSQYAGWKLSTKNYFAMASGPMRAAAGQEELFKKLEYKEAGYGVVGVLESGRIPGPDVVKYVAKACGVSADHVALLVAPTASIAGNMQVIARCVETAMHKLFELKFDVNRVESAAGWAPISPVAEDDITAIGRTNDAILYGGRVTLWVNGDDESIRELGPRIPSSGSAMHGRPFLELFEAAGRDFYKMDPHLFSPAEIVLHNVETGRVHHFGGVREDVLRKSFGL